MAQITTQMLLDAAREAYLAALKAASLTHGDRTKVNQQIDKLSAEVQRLESKLLAEQAAAARRGPMLVFGDFSRRA